MNEKFNKWMIALASLLFTAILHADEPIKLREEVGARHLATPPVTSKADKLRLLRIITLNVNFHEAADAHLIITPSGKTMLIDAGMPAHGTQVVLPYLKQRGIATIDWMMASHFHNDHFGGMPPLILSDAVRVKELLWSPVPFDKMEKLEAICAKESGKIRDEIEKACAARNITIRVVRKGNSLDLGDGVKGEILMAAEPEQEVGNYINNNSIVMRLAYGRFSEIFTGDAGFEEENKIMAAHKDLASDVLKIGHHAGAGSTSQAWVNAIRAKVGIAPMHERLSRDAQGLRVWHLLMPTGMKIYRTWKHGHIEIQTDGERFWVLTEK